MLYVIHEKNRMPARQSYAGPLCQDHTPGQVYKDLRTAQRDLKKLGEGFAVSKQPDSEPLPFDLTQGK